MDGYRAVIPAFLPVIPAKAGIQKVAILWSTKTWGNRKRRIPAFLMVGKLRLAAQTPSS